MPAPGTNWLSRALLRLEGFSRRNHRKVLIGAVGLFLIGTALSATLTLRTDILELLPQRDPAVRAFRDAARIFGALDTFPVALEAPEDYSADDYEEFADRLAGRLRHDPAVAGVDSRIDLDSPLVRYFQEHLPLFLEPGDLPNLEAKLRDDEIRAVIAENRGLLEISPFPQAKEMVLRDPLHLTPLLLHRFTAGRGSSGVRWSDGYITSKDGRSLLLLVRPARPAQDVASAKQIVARVREAIEATRAELERIDPTLPPPRAILGGRYAISVADSELILSDIGFTMTFSFLGVIGLYLFCYRRLGAVLYSALPLVLGQCLTFTLARIAFGSLNSSTATSAALLMGLGTDFTIVMYARYVEERRAGKGIEESSRIMMGEAALGVYTGAITSAGTFGALMVTSYVGLRQFGFLVGSGILLCLLCILFLLPALLRAFEEGRKKPPTLYVHSFGFERLIPLARRHPKTVLAICLAVSVAAVPLALKLRYSESIDDLRSEGNAGLAAQREIAERFGSDEKFSMVLVRGKDAEDAESRARRIESVLASLRDRGGLSRVEGLGALLPDPAGQEEVRRLLREGGAAFDPVRVEATMRDALRAQGFRGEDFEDAIATVTRSLRPEEAVTSADLSAHGGAELVGRFLRKDKEGGGWAAVTFAYGPFPPEGIAEVHAADPEARVTGVAILSGSLKHLLRRDVMICILLGLAIVLVLLWTDFRSLGDAMLAVTQLLVGLLWMFGLMRIWPNGLLAAGWALLRGHPAPPVTFGIPLTQVNAFAAALLLGVGIDYGIHILHRLRGPDKGDEWAIRETGKAVAMATMTNIVGFGVLVFSNYPGLQGLGKAAVLGSVGCLLTALTLMPALEAILSRRRRAA